MGIRELLCNMPDGKKYHQGFLDLGWKGNTVPIDAAGALYQFASSHAADFLKNNHHPSLILWARWLVYLRSMCCWKLKIYFDGMENTATQKMESCLFSSFLFHVALGNKVNIIQW